jgi:hypothetical protein
LITTFETALAEPRHPELAAALVLVAETERPVMAIAIEVKSPRAMLLVFMSQS